MEANEVLQNSEVTTGEKVTTLKELVLSKLNIDTDKNTIVIKKDEKDMSKLEKGNVLDYLTNGTTVITQKKTLSLRERLELATSGKADSDNMSGNEELSMDARTDIFDLNGRSLEVAAAKVLNQVVNDQKYEDQVYFLVKLSVGVTKVENSILELLSPYMMKESEHLQKREKATYDDKTKLVIKRVSPFRYEFSTVIPSEYGAMDMYSMDGLNKMISYIDQLLARIMEYNYTSGEISADRDILAKHSLAMGNKSRIKNYISNILRETQGEEVSQIDIDDQTNQIVDKIWERMHVRSLTDKRLDIELQVLKIHRSSNPAAFTTGRRNVTIMKDDSGSVKIERLKYSLDKSVPYLVSQEKEISGFLSELVGYFTVWAENEARHSLGCTHKDNPYKLSTLYPNNKKVLTVLGYSDQEAKMLTEAVSKMVTEVMVDEGHYIENEALANKMS